MAAIFENLDIEILATRRVTEFVSYIKVLLHKEGKYKKSIHYQGIKVKLLKSLVSLNNIEVLRKPI